VWTATSACWLVRDPGLLAEVSTEDLSGGILESGTWFNGFSN